MYCSPPGSSTHGIIQARTLKWVAVLCSRGSSQHRVWTLVSCLLHWEVSSLPLAPPGNPPKYSTRIGQSAGRHLLSCVPSSHYATHSAGSIPPIRYISRCQGSHTYLFRGLLRHCSTSPMGLSDTCPLFLLLHVMRSFTCEQIFSQAGGGMDTCAQMWQLFLLYPCPIPSPPVGSDV